jgi:hypothetical protein
MIRMQDGGITWEHEDVRMMAKILGSEFAVIPQSKERGWAPSVMSILKLAQRKGLPLSKKAEQVLESAEEHYHYTRELKLREDAELDEPRARRYFRHQRADLSLMYQLPDQRGWLIASEAGVGKTLPAIRYAVHVGAQRTMLIVQKLDDGAPANCRSLCSTEHQNIRSNRSSQRNAGGSSAIGNR